MSVSKLDEQIETKYGWHVGFNKRFDPDWKPFSRPRIKQMIEYIPLFIRWTSFQIYTSSKQVLQQEILFFWFTDIYADGID